MAVTLDQSAFQKRRYAIVGGGALGLSILVWVVVKAAYRHEDWRWRH